MAEIYGHRWTASFGERIDQGHAWASVLAGMTGQQIATGLNHLVSARLAWPPTAPEFLGFCEARPTAESLGLPTEEKAFAEAVRKTHPAMTGCNWSHDAVYHAAAECGFYNLQTLQQDASRKLFARNYAMAVRDLIDGKPLKARPLALTHGVEARVTPEVGRAGISALRAAMKAPRLTELPEHMAHLAGGA